MPIPTGAGQVNIVFTGSGVPHGAEVVFGILNTISSLSPADVCVAVDNAIDSSGLAANLSNDVNMTSVRCKLGPDATGPSAEKAVGHTGTGGTGASPNVAWLVRKNTEFGGKAGRGRMYFPGVPESVVNNAGDLLSGSVTAFQTDLNAFHAALAAADIPMYLLHGVGSPLTTPSEVTSLVLDDLAATQRRRLRR